MSPHSEVGSTPNEKLVASSRQLDGLRAIQKPGAIDFIPDLIDEFLDQAGTQMKVLHEAVANNDVLEIRRVAHLLKGSSANIGARQMPTLCAKLEGNGLANGDTEALLKRLDQEFQLVRAALQAER